MPIVTPVWSIPSPTSGEPPNGPAQMKGIADATEIGLNALYTRSPRLFQQSMTGGDLTAVGVTVDLPGASITLSVAAANTPVMVTGVIESGIGSGNFVAGYLSVNGTIQNKEIRGGDVVRASASQTWAITLGAGTHVLKLRAGASAGTCTVYQTHTNITALVLGP